MNKFSDNFKCSVVGSIKKQIILRNEVPPENRLIEFMLNRLALNPKLKITDSSDSKKVATSLMDSVLGVISNYAFLGALKIQLYFGEQHLESDEILKERRRTVKQSTESLLSHILLKRIKKSKEDSDQLYHNICCYIILLSGIGDPTDDEVLKETTDALKSILSTKEMSRFVLKPNFLKEAHLADLCSVVTGIRIYNKESKKGEDADFIVALGNSFERYSCYLEGKTRAAEKQVSKLIRVCLRYYNASLDTKLTIEQFQDVDTFSSTVHQMKSYVILLQQWIQYLRIVIEECNNLMKEFHSFSLVLNQRVQRVRKTVKYRTAIPVVEIYPQFRDISSSWTKYQDLSTLLDYFSNVLYDLNTEFSKVPEPDLEAVPDFFRFDTLKMEVRDKETIRNENSCCTLVMPEDDQDFYKIPVEYSAFCVVTLADTQGLPVAGIREYGLIEYRRKYYTFSTLTAMVNFCQKPEKYIEEIEKIVFLWPQLIGLLNIEKYFQQLNSDTELKKGKSSSASDAGVQTDIHPLLKYEEYNHSPYVWQLQKRIAHLTSFRKCGTHAIQTVESSFRRNSSTQTEQTNDYK